MYKPSTPGIQVQLPKEAPGLNIKPFREKVAKCQFNFLTNIFAYFWDHCKIIGP